MMNTLKTVDRLLGTALRVFCVANLLTLTAILGAVVFIRFFPIAKLSWSDEIIEWLMASLIFMAAAALWRENDHFKIDALARLLAGTTFGRLFWLGLEILTAVFILLFAQYSLDLTLSVGRTSPILSWPVTWWYAPMPTAGFIMLAYSVRNIVQGFRAVVDGFKQGADRPGAA
ncbi:MAG: TRAP transporter small permease subunit [Rhodospirillales bacterium]|nr:TRAP transporter small permease subunit [Rhodospirillales bacterium]